MPDFPEFPSSPRSFTSSSKDDEISDLGSGSPRLNPDVLALLDSHFSEKAEEERLFNELAADQAAARVAGLALDTEADEDSQKVEDKPMISVAEFKLAFGEDWQLSQFWYAEEFAYSFASRLHSLCTPSTNIAFVCCPTTFVAFQHTKPLPGAALLEYDQRFALLSPKQFVPYDLDEPDVFPESLKERFDIVVVDPPFLNEVTNRKVSQTLRQILKPEGKSILLTSTSVEEVILKIYDKPPLGPLRRTAIEVKHGRLANDFACWGSWEGAEHLGKD